MWVLHWDGPRTRSDAPGVDRYLAGVNQWGEKEVEAGGEAVGEDV